MNPNLDNLLSRLTKVKGRNGSWIACCPAHSDRNPSMTIRETEEGKILLHCFAGCSVGEIAGAIGFDLTDLFPPKQDGYDYNQDRSRPRFFASDLLKVMQFEATVVALAASTLAAGRPLSTEDLQRLRLAQSRITEALEMSQ
jgi:hypothetical protein